MFCNNCGLEISKDDRSCFNCGAVNIHNKENEEFLTNASKVKVKEKYDGKLNVPYLIVNLILFSILLLFDLLFIKFIPFLYSALGITIAYFYFFSYQKLLIKAALPWWGVFIPIYNIYLWYKLTFDSGVMFTLLQFLIPLFILVTMPLFVMLDMYKVTQILYALYLLYTSVISILSLYLLGKNFGRSGILTILFFYVIIPSVAFSKQFKYNA